MEREPFTESEKRFVVTQVLMASSIPIEILVQLFAELNEPPRWEHIYLPSGRTLQECRATFESFCKPINSPLSYTSTSARGGSTPTNSPLNKRKSNPRAIEIATAVAFEHKRRLSGAKAVERSAQQPILPKPSPNESPSSGTGSFATMPVIRRRGRPPKAEVERRQQEAVARGEVIVPLAMENQTMTQAPLPTQAPAHLQVSTKNTGYSGYVPIAPAPAPPDPHSPGVIGSRNMGPNIAESGPSTPQRIGPSRTTDNKTIQLKNQAERLFPFPQTAQQFAGQEQTSFSSILSRPVQKSSGSSTQKSTPNILSRPGSNDRAPHRQ
ncbi:hypothetical protein K3495_g2416 [Podosphaera aphanis]|nr:hypothetical protein K3495_g2416 [Podosphaera aphanis]